MLDLCKRALLNPVAYSGALKKRTLTFISKQHEGGITYTFTFKPAQPVSWRPGQHGVFYLPGHKLSGKQWRAFSVAASAHEEVIRIGTTIPELHSDFKQILLNLQPGDTVRMRGPFGEFHPSGLPKERIVGIAGGIGITPFRAIAHEIAHGQLPHTSLELIYAGKDGFYAYEELMRTYGEHPNLTVTFVDTPAHVNACIDEKYQLYGNQARYFISGSSGMITAIKSRLRDLGARRIVNDPFKGY